FTAQVSPALATGTVLFQDGGSNLGTPVTLHAGAAHLTISFLSVGSHKITAAYSGDVSFVPSVSPAFTQVVMAGGGGGNPTFTAFTATAQTFFRQSASFNVFVTSSSGQLSGSVVLLDGNTQLGPLLSLFGISPTFGIATYSTPLRAGTHNIRAIYLGNDGFDGSF